MRSIPAIILFITGTLGVSVFTLLASGCVTDQPDQKIYHSYEYKKLDISSTSIQDSLKPGMSILVETSDIYGWFTVIGYEGNEALVCIDEHDIKKQKVTILVKDIETVRLRNTVTTTYDTGNFTDSTGLSFYEQTIQAGTTLLIIILLLVVFAA